LFCSRSPSIFFKYPKPEYKDRKISTKSKENALKEAFYLLGKGLLNKFDIPVDKIETALSRFMI